MSTALPFPLPVAAYGRAEPRPVREKLLIAGMGFASVVLLSMFFSAIESSGPKKVHPTLRRVR